MTNPQPVSIKPPGNGNEKGFPLKPTPENLYFYSYSRAQRRKHSKEEKEKLLNRVWHNYQEWKKKYEKMYGQYPEVLKKEPQKEVKDGSKR